MIESLTGTHADWVVGIARIVLGIIFFAHGAQKMLGWYGGPGLASSMRTFTEHLHLPSALAFLVIAGEFFGGIGLIVGLLSRIAALFIALTMVGAVATVHLRFGLFLNWFGNQEGHGIEYHLLAIALTLVLVVKGAGAFSLDRLVHERVSELGQSVAVDTRKYAFAGPKDSARSSTFANGVMPMVGNAGPAVAQDNGVEHASARQQLQHIRTP